MIGGACAAKNSTLCCTQHKAARAGCGQELEKAGVRDAGRGHLHVVEGEDSEAREGGDVVGEGGHGAAVEDQLLQADQPPRLLRQPPQIVVLPHSSIGTLCYRYAVLSVR